MPIAGLLKPNTYRDSVALMVLSTALAEAEGVVQASAMMATPANVEILRATGLFADGVRRRPARTTSASPSRPATRRRPRRRWREAEELLAAAGRCRRRRGSGRQRGEHGARARCAARSRPARTRTWR